MGKSQKFKLLKQISKTNCFTKVVYGFTIVTTADSVGKDFFHDDKSYILRSSLRGEGQTDSLLSGKSISIKGIKTHSSFLSAFHEVHNQIDLDEVLLQEEFLYEDHLTIYAEAPFYYVEIKNKEGVKFVIISSDFVSGQYHYLKFLKDFLEQWSKFFSGQKIILEAGMNSQGIKIFQANGVNEKIMNTLFNNDLLFKMIRSEIRKESGMNLLSLMSKEFKAYKFRKELAKKNSFSIQDAFNNWSYVFHYFFIYCQFFKKPGTDQSFVDYLNSLQNKSHWFSKIAATHILLSSKIRSGEDLNGEVQIASAFRLVSEKTYFLGKGIHKGKVKDIAHLCEELIPDEIYQLNPNKIILTSSHHILSYGFLVAFERGNPRNREY